MKSIVYILITLFISSILLSSLPKPTPNEKETVKIHCTNNHPDYNLLKQSGEIIKTRLESFGYKDFEVSVPENQNSLEIVFNDKVDLSTIRPLFTSKGKFEFYETYDREEVIKQLSKDDSLFILLNIPPKNEESSGLKSNAILGYSSAGNVLKVDHYLNSRDFKGITTMKIQFAWRNKLSPDNTCEIFVLKKNPFLNGSFVEKCDGKFNSDSDNADIIIKFTKEGASVWKEKTRQNIDRSIAMVMDSKVYYAPKVMSEIKNGRCKISGDFSTDEAKILISLISNEELPLDFELIE
jgi:SecD/SecF fusion protein